MRSKVLVPFALLLLCASAVAGWKHAKTESITLNTAGSDSVTNTGYAVLRPTGCILTFGAAESGSVSFTRLEEGATPGQGVLLSYDMGGGTNLFISSSDFAGITLDENDVLLIESTGANTATGILTFETEDL